MGADHEAGLNVSACCTDRASRTFARDWSSETNRSHFSIVFDLIAFSKKTFVVALRPTARQSAPPLRMATFAD
jgi:hypothetical protein